MRWVADTGPLLHLAEAGALGLLPLLGEVFVPPAVAQEWRGHHSRFPTPIPAIEIPLDPANTMASGQWCMTGLIQRGEAEAIGLARQLRADVFLTDDAAARVFAASLGLQVRGSLGVILWLAAKRHVAPAEASRLLDALEKTSLWLSPRVKAEARQALTRIQSEGP